MTAPIVAGAVVSSPVLATAPLDRPEAAEPASSAAPAAGWIVLADPAESVSTRPPVPMRRIVAPIAAAALIVAGVVGLAGSLVSQRIAEQQAVHDVAQLTDVLADSVVQPAL